MTIEYRHWCRVDRIVRSRSDGWFFCLCRPSYRESWRQPMATHIRVFARNAGCVNHRNVAWLCYRPARRWESSSGGRARALACDGIGGDTAQEQQVTWTPLSFVPKLSSPTAQERQTVGFVEMIPPRALW